MMRLDGEDVKELKANIRRKTFAMIRMPIHTGTCFLKSVEFELKKDILSLQIFI